MTGILPEITEVQRLRLAPGDALVVRTPVQLDMYTAERVKAQVRATLRIGEDVPVLVLPAGMKLGVVASS